MDWTRHTRACRGAPCRRGQYLHTHNVPRALLTRNQQAAVDHLVRVSGTSFVAMLTRDFEPVKPSPLPLLHICERALVRTLAGELARAALPGPVGPA